MGGLAKCEATSTSWEATHTKATPFFFTLAQFFNAHQYYLIFRNSMGVDEFRFEASQFIKC